MSDYSRAYDGAAKDAAEDTVLGSDFDSEFDLIQTAVNTKADKIVSGTNGNLISQDADGNLVDSGASKDTPEFDDLTVTEAADHTTTPAAGKGIFWVKSDAPCSPMFTDDSGNDLELPAPTGAIFMWPTATSPTGWLECDGSAVSRTTYAKLFALIGETYGNGDGSTTFNLPDMRGEFPRGWDNGAGNDPDAASRTDRGDGTTGDNVGTKQGHALETHVHTNGAWLGGTGLGGNVGTWGSSSSNTGSPATGTVSANETRGRNIALMFIIKW